MSMAFTAFKFSLSTPYVDRLVVAAVCSFENVVVVRLQKQHCGKHGHGPVDFGLESRHTTNTLGVTEIKKRRGLRRMHSSLKHVWYV
ncbi:hypothetical protein BC937DRAFT_94296 [Endogone sp. FLAS-F59071]|nr:hypothetical protein BC937DRAFT_94296 [Endogone sp. FLAS-F59071]|eukprot:RUS14128.1 hypothetical protein BC937DRAFT_94296 [Endogone sp. FLAS-F59071]